MAAWLAVLGFLHVLNPSVAKVADVLVAGYFLYHTLQSFCAAEVRRADQVAWALYHKQTGKIPDLPEKLKGVFWMSTNAAPELLCTLDGQTFNPETRTINLDAGSKYSWSHSTGTVGWAYWFALRVAYMFCAEMHVKFDSDDYTHADLPLYLWGCCTDGAACDGIWMPMGMWWTMDQVDENTWDRNIFLYCMPWRRWELGSYKLRRVIDGSGIQLPAFDEMMASIQGGERIKGIMKKPMMQIMNGSGWKHRIRLGRARSPDIEQGMMAS